MPPTQPSIAVAAPRTCFNMHISSRRYPLRAAASSSTLSCSPSGTPLSPSSTIPCNATPTNPRPTPYTAASPGPAKAAHLRAP